MNIILKTILLSLLAMLLIRPDLCAQPKKPNIVFFLVDDLGWTDVEPSSPVNIPLVGKLYAYQLITAKTKMAIVI